MTIVFTPAWWMIMPLLWTILFGIQLIWKDALAPKKTRGFILMRWCVEITLMMLVRFLP